MQSYSLAYGKTWLDFSFPDFVQVQPVAPVFVRGAEDPLVEVGRALDQGLDGINLDRFQNAKTVGIALNDKTRPVPLHLLLPPLVARLERMGIPSQNIRFYFAAGTHAPMTPAEIRSLLPPALVERHPVYSHDCDAATLMVDLGKTSYGTPVLCSESFLGNDLKIVTGNIEPHHFAGFSGGVKTFSIGLAGRETINRNHSLLLDPRSRTGEFENNPLRQDIEEIGRLAKIDLALNAVLNEKKEIVRAFFGSPLDVMQAGIPIARQVCQTPVRGRYDLVVASVGGHPKDINLYQAQKALTHASMLTRDGGVVILVGACPEGSGSQGFEDQMIAATSPADVLQKFDRFNFRVGPHKAFQFARELVRIRVILLSELPAELVRRLFLLPASTPKEALGAAFDLLPAAPSVAILPRAINTIPLVEPLAG